MLQGFAEWAKNWMGKYILSKNYSWRYKSAVLVFTLGCCFPSLQATGLLTSFRIDSQILLAIAFVSGVAGGMLFCSRPVLPGCVGGPIAGVGGFLGVVWYTSGKESVFNVEVVFVQLIASLPGVLIGVLLLRRAYVLDWERQEASELAEAGSRSRAIDINPYAPPTKVDRVQD
jgi:hypothetical protein